LVNSAVANDQLDQLYRAFHERDHLLVPGYVYECCNTGFAIYREESGQRHAGLIQMHTAVMRALGDIQNSVVSAEVRHCFHLSHTADFPIYPDLHRFWKEYNGTNGNPVKYEHHTYEYVMIGDWPTDPFDYYGINHDYRLDALVVGHVGRLIADELMAIDLECAEAELQLTVLSRLNWP